MTKQETPSDLTPSYPTLIDIQNEVREYFGWTEENDLESAIAMLRRVEDSTVGIWARHNRAASLSKIFRRIVIREARVAILGAAVEPEEIASILDGPTLIVAADGAVGAISEMPASLSEKAWSRWLAMPTAVKEHIKQLEDQFPSYYMHMETIEKIGTTF